MNTIQADNRIAQLEIRLKAARERAKELNAELAKIKRKADRADGNVEELQEEIARLQIEGWGKHPNWPLMLKTETMTMYYALEAHLARIGLLMHHSWSDTGERIVAIGMNSGEVDAIARNAAAIRLIMPHMKAHVGGSVWFMIMTSTQSHCLWTLRIHPKKNKHELVQEVHSTVEQRLPFPTLEAALAHVQRHLWLEDIIDAAPVALIEHTAADA